MKKLILLLAAISLSCSLSSQTTLTHKEEKFVKHVSQISLLEIKIGELAETHALSVEVKAAAKRLVDDYKQTKEQITGLAAKKNITVASELDPKPQKFYNYFAKKQGTDFDKAYLKCTSKANKKGICKVKKLYKHTDDSDLKDWSGKMLSTLEIHKTLLKQTAEASKKVE